MVDVITHHSNIERWIKRRREMVKERKVDGERKTGRCHEWEG